MKQDLISFLLNDVFLLECAQWWRLVLCLIALLLIQPLLIQLLQTQLHLMVEPHPLYRHSLLNSVV